MAQDTPLNPDSAWLLSFGAYLAVGSPLLLHAEYRQFSLIGRGLLAASVGAVATSWIMTAFALLSIPWSPIGIATAALGVCCSLRLALRGSSPDTPGPSEPARLGLAGTLAIALCAAAVLVAFSVTRSGGATSSDLLYFWGVKAQRFALARTIDVGFLADPLLDYMHPDYPPLLTNLYAFATMIAGHFSWPAAAVLFPVLLAFTAASMGSILASDGSRDLAWLSAALTTCCLSLIGIEAAIGGVGEMPLLVFEMLAISLLVLDPPIGEGRLLLAGLCLAGAAGTKVEGLPFSLAASGLFLIIVNAPLRRWRAFFFLLTPTIVTLGTWFLFGGRNGLFWFYKGYGPLLPVQWERIPHVAEETLYSIAKIGYGLPFLLPLLLFLGVSRKPRAVLVPVGTAAALVGFLLATYSSGEGDVAQLISWSAARVLIPLPGLFVVAAFKAGLPKLGRSPRRPSQPDPPPRSRRDRMVAERRRPGKQEDPASVDR